MSRIDANIPAADRNGDAAPLPRFEFLAGRLALDFCNSHSRANGGDRLSNPAGLAAWAERCGRALPVPPSQRDLVRFRTLRDHLCRLFDAILQGAAPAQADLDAIADAARPGEGERLQWDAARRQAVRRSVPQSCDGLHQSIAADAVDLVTHAKLDRLKRCPSETCHWFFFDSSRNGKRRWCAMADCGTRAKVRHYRARQAFPADAAF